MDTWYNTDCPICQGHGFVYPVVDGKVDYSQTVPCRCIRERIEKEKLARLIDSCQFPPNSENMTIDKFKIYPELKTAYDATKDMATHPGVVSWLALLGDNGTGKTHLAIAICRAWVKAGIPSRYVLTSLFLDELRQGYKHDGDDSYDNKFRYYCEVPLLLLDDCGIQSSTNWVQEKLDTIVDYRLMNNKSLIITANKSLDEMSPRIRSRLMRLPNSKRIAMIAEDYGMRGKK